MIKKILTYGAVLIVGLGVGAYAMNLKDSRDVEKSLVDIASKAAKSNIATAVVIYGTGADHVKEITLQAIDVVNKPENANLINDEVKAFAKEIHQKIEDGDIAPPTDSK